jgi:transcriptional regulator GlxA family with amidase domain
MRAWGAKVYSTTAPRSAPEPSCWRRLASSMAAGQSRIGSDAPNSPADLPRCVSKPDPIFVRDGNIWTSAGITAGIDLALALVEEDLGPQVALAVARQLVVFLKRPGGQAQFSATLALQQGDARFERLHAWIADNLRRDLSVASLADAASMSERSFIRHYRRATGMTPARATERIRVEAARQVLEQGLPVKRVAARCGFGSEETMRRSFLRLLGATPQAYRERFSSGSSQSMSREKPAPRA